MKRIGLIGHTGFVGATLYAAGGYDAAFNSKNIDDIRGSAFSRLVCAGVSATKWLANKNPEQDLEGINRLVGALDTVSVNEFILISTVDVFENPNAVYEDSVVPVNSQAYGRNRRQLERWAAERFKNTTIVRLPGLFGPGLKKNIIFDLMNDNNIEAISPYTTFQFYPTRRLPGDIAVIAAQGLGLVHIAPQPLPTRQILDRFFPLKAHTLRGVQATSYDLRTRHPQLFGTGAGDYQFSTAETIGELGAYLADPK